MANNDVIQAKQLVTDLTDTFIKQKDEVSKLAIKINELSNDYKTLILPSQFKDSATIIDNATKSLNGNEQVINSLIVKKKELQARTSEEIVNNRLLAKSADLATIENSKLAGAYANLDAKAKQASKALRDLIVEGKQATETQIQFNTRLEVAQAEFDLYNKKLLQADKAVGAWSRSNVRSIEGMQNMTAGIKNAMGAFGIFTGMFLAAQVVMSGISINEKLSDDLAQLQINLKGTKQDAEDVYESLKKIETRTSLSDLLGLAEIVAKKGVAKEEISGIVKELDSLFLVMNVANKEESTASVVKLISIFHADGKITEERIKGIGSSLQYLTTHGVATIDYLINFSERLGAFRSLTGQTLPQIQGLGAGFEQLGQRVEVSSNATGQIITKLMSNAEKYAKMANIPLQKFKDLLETNSSEALLQFAEGIKANSHSLEEFSTSFEDVGLKGARVKGVLAELSINGDLFRAKIEASKKAMDDLGTTAESSAIKQNTFAGTVDKIKKEFEILVTNQKVQDFFSDIAVSVYYVVKAITMIPFSLIIGGLTAWAVIQAKLKGEIIAGYIAQQWNNEVTLLGIVRSTMAKWGLLGEAEALRAKALLTKTSTELLKEKIIVQQEEIVVEQENIATLEAEMLASGENNVAKEASIVASKAKITAIETEIAITEKAIVANEAMTASLVATPWGAIAVGIGLVVAGLYELATAQTEEEKASERLKEYHKNNIDDLKAENDLNAKDKQRKFDEIDLETRKEILAGKSREQAMKENAEAKLKYTNIKILAINDEMKRDEEDLKGKEKLLDIDKNRNKEAQKNASDFSLVSTFHDKDVEIETEKAKWKQYYEDRKNDKINSILELKKLSDTEGVDSEEKQKELSNKQKELNDKAIEAQRKANEALAQAKAEWLKIIHDTGKDEYELEKYKREQEILGIDKIAKDEKKSFEERLQAYGSMLDKKQSLANYSFIYETKQIEEGKQIAIEESNKKYRQEVKNAEGNASIISQITKYHNEELLTINKDYSAKLKLNKEKYTADILKNTDDECKAEEELLAKKNDFIAKNEKQLLDEQIKKAKELADDDKANFGVRVFAHNIWKALKIQEIETERKNALEKAGNNAEEIKYINNKYDIEIRGLKGLSSAEIEAKKNAEQLKNAIESYAKSFVDSFGSKSPVPTLFKVLNKEIAGFGKNWKSTTLAVSAMVGEMYNYIKSQSEGTYQAELSRLQTQKDTAIKFAGESSVAKAEIDRQYAEKKRRLDAEKAKRDKESAIFNIILSTAQGVIGASPDLGLMATIGAVGLVELAIAQSQPIPQYFAGTENHKGGAMIVNDAKSNNYKETVVTPDGNVFKPQDRNVLMNAPIGTKVFTPEQWHAIELQNMLNNIGISPFSNELITNTSSESVVINNGWNSDEFNNGINRLANEIANKTELEVIQDKRGYRSYKRKNNQRVEELSNHIRFLTKRT